MKFKLISLFPEMLEDILSVSIIGRAVKDEKLEIEYIQLRDYSENKHKKVDDYPYGGGAGMVMQMQPIVDALKTVSGRVIYLTPKGQVFNQALAKELALEEELVFLCGHYEGIDQRIIDHYVTDEVSIGDFVLTGGELPAMVMMDAVARLKEGVLGQNISYEDESHYNGLLEYPHYTRPSNYEGMLVPDVLISGNHKKIEDYRLEESIKLTAERRPDMIEKYAEGKLSKNEIKILRKYIDK